MTAGNGHVIDPAGEARRALQAAMAEHGPQALSNAVIMDRICRDRLAGLPGEAILIGSAARSDVPVMLRQQVASLGVDAAIQSAAATLAEAQALDAAACVWVVGEFAQALGYKPPGGTPPAAGASPAAFTDQGDALPPGSAGPPASSGSSAGAPPSPPGPPGGTAVQGEPPSGSRLPPRNALGVAAAVALVAVYFGIAAVAHLTPFNKTPAANIHPPGPASSGPASQSASAASAPSPAPDPDPDPSAPVSSPAQALLNLIPSSNQGSGCPTTKNFLGAIAVRECTGVPYGTGSADAAVTYYLFANDPALNNAYADYLSAFGIREGAGNCEDFKSYVPPCETAITNTNPRITGRAAEFTYKGYADLISSDEQQDVLVYMAAPDGQALLNWWLYPGRWIVTGN